MEVFQEGGRLVAGSQRLNETADTLLDHPHQIPPVDVFCTQVLVSYVSAAGRLAHSPPYIQHKVEGHCICLRRHLTPSVSSAPLANLSFPPCLLE